MSAFRFATLVAAVGLVVGGVAGLVHAAFFAAGASGWMAVGCGLAVFLGGYWLWADFIDPISRREK